MSQGTLAMEVGVSKEYISMVETGKRTPGLETLYRLANFFNKNIDYFLKEEESPFAVMLRAEKLSLSDKKYLLKFQKIIEDYYFLEEVSGQKLKPSAAYSPPGEKQVKDKHLLIDYVESISRQERERLGLGLRPSCNFYALIENEGVRLVRFKLPKQSNISGAFFNYKNQAFIFINASMPSSRQLFTLAHEYCHYLIFRDQKFEIDYEGNVEEASVSREKPLSERIADIFAANFLIPKEALDKFKADFNNRFDIEEIIYLKRYFGVSYQAMLYRLKNLNYIKHADLEYLRNVKPSLIEREFFGPSNEEPAKDIRFPSERFHKLALDAYLNNKITIGRLAEILEKDVFAVHELLAESGLLKRRKNVPKKGSD